VHVQVCADGSAQSSVFAGDVEHYWADGGDSWPALAAEKRGVKTASNSF